MISTKPYLIRAIREWASDNDLTPQILVDAEADDVRVPDSHVRDGQIILNISDEAVEIHQLGNDFLMFSARFNGVPFHVEVPVEAVLAIYARENGQGIFFKEPAAASQQERKEDQEPDRPSGKPHLKVIK